MDGFKCDACSKPIYGASMIIEGQFFHQECKTTKDVKEKKDKKLLKMS